MTSYIIFACPHCNEMIMVDKADINCNIFRHGVFKVGGQQIASHSPKDYCDMVVKKGLIYGCGKPFQLNGAYAKKCDYI